MIRTIIKIDEEKCNGCGLCVTACHEGAIGMENGKAKLLRDDYCDGLGNCLPVCPTGAITFEEREAAAFDEEAVKENMEKAAATAAQHQHHGHHHHGGHGHGGGGCPGSRMRQFTPPQPSPAASARQEAAGGQPSQLRQWPVQIKLVPVNAPYFDGAKLLIAADCTAYAYAGFHERFIKDKITLIGCPKLDEGDYSEKLTAILAHNDIKSVTIVRMEVPCCAGIAHAAVTALQRSGKMIPWQVVTVSVDGEIIED